MRVSEVLASRPQVTTPTSESERVSLLVLSRLGSEGDSVALGDGAAGELDAAALGVLGQLENGVGVQVDACRSILSDSLKTNEDNF